MWFVKCRRVNDGSRSAEGLSDKFPIHDVADKISKRCRDTIKANDRAAQPAKRTDQPRAEMSGASRNQVFHA
jgi:hypothetical protein